MFIVFLRFSDNKARAGEFMAAHNAWVARGFAEGVFQLVGSLEPRAGGAILAHGETRSALEARINADPFVIEGIVSAEIHAISPARAAEPLEFLLT